MFSQAETDIYLQCPYCAWDSRASGEVTFTKTSSLFTQLRTLSRASQSAGNDDESVFESKQHEPSFSLASQFDALASQYKDLYREPTPPSSPLLPSRSITRSLETTRFLKSYYKTHSASSSPVTPESVLNVIGRVGGVSRDKVAAAEKRESEKHIIRLDEAAEEDLIAGMESMKSLNESMTLSQQRRQASFFGSVSPELSLLKPVPTRLCTRRAKRCRACRHLLVRPEISKNSAATLSTAFRIKQLCKDYIPTIRMTHLSSATYPKKFVTHITYTFALTLFNPRLQPIKITLASPPRTPTRNHSITLLTPTFEINGNLDDKNDWDLRALSDLKERFTKFKDGDGAQAAGVFAIGANWTCVLIEIVPSDEGGEIEIPIFVSVGYDVADEPEGKEEMAFWTLARVGVV